jgi:hypothetical protein
VASSGENGIEQTVTSREVPRRSLVLDVQSFPESMLPESDSVSPMRRISSLKEREEHVLLVAPSSSAPREKRDWGGESGHFSNGCPK